MKRNIRIGLIVLIIIILGTGLSFASEEFLVRQDKGSLIVTSHLEGANNKVRVVSEYEEYVYKLNNGETEIPLQFGDGNYEVHILKHKEGNTYSIERKINITAKDVLEKDVFTGGNESINWRNSAKSIEKAKELTKGLKTDKEKVVAIYNYVFKSIEYDHKKASTVQGGYSPTIDETLESNKGICYDYASLFAGMLRSEGIPTKLIKGYNKDIVEYHAWNEVLIDNNWIIIDTTYDASYFAANREINMEKRKEDYKTIKSY